jgi:hypothetical protein
MVIAGAFGSTPTNRAFHGAGANLVFLNGFYLPSVLPPIVLCVLDSMNRRNPSFEDGVVNMGNIVFVVNPHILKMVDPYNQAVHPTAYVRFIVCRHYTQWYSRIVIKEKPSSCKGSRRKLGK